MNIIIGNMFGLIASVVDAVAYFRKSKKDIIVVKQFVSFMYLIQNIFLHAYTALVDVIVSIIRNFVFIKFKKDWLFLVFSCIKIVLMFTLGYEGYITWVAAFIECIYSITVSFFSVQALRRVQIVKSVYWSIYSFIHIAISSGIMSIISAVLVGIALYKNRKKEEVNEAQGN